MPDLLLEHVAKSYPTRAEPLEILRDVNLALVVIRDSAETLDKIGPALRLARAAVRVETLILRHDELQRAADVFPLLYDDIRKCHSVLAGVDVFSSLEIHDEHRRLRVEQELRDARVQLRGIVVGDGILGSTINAPLSRLIKAVRCPLHVLLEWKLASSGRKIKDDTASVMLAAGETWGGDTSSLTSPERNPSEAMRALRTILEGAVDDVDRLEPVLRRVG